MDHNTITSIGFISAGIITIIISLKYYREKNNDLLDKSNIIQGLLAGLLLIAVGVLYF